MKRFKFKGQFSYKGKSFVFKILAQLLYVRIDASQKPVYVYFSWEMQVGKTVFHILNYSVKFKNYKNLQSAKQIARFLHAWHKTK